MLRICTLIVGVSISPIMAQSVDTPEPSDSLAVRAVYAKVLLAVRLGDLRDRLTSGAASSVAPATDGLQIVLSPITTGLVTEISTVPLSELVTKPAGDTLTLSPGVWTYETANGQKLTGEIASVQWGSSGYLAEDWNIPIGELIQRGSINEMYSRYASLTVDISYEGRQRQYRALFLFGEDSLGHPSVLALDHILGAPALKALWGASPIPEPLLGQAFRSRPEVEAFINSLAAPMGCTMEQRTNMCCDETSHECKLSLGALQVAGFGAAGVSDALGVKPACSDYCDAYDKTGTKVNASASDQSDHLTGSHGGSVSFQGHCSYDGNDVPCVGLCNVHVIGGATSESGITINYLCHQRPTATDIHDVDGNSSACSSSWGIGVEGCSTCTCDQGISVGLPVSGGGATVTWTSGGAGVHLWTYGHGLSYGPCVTVR
ncbi:MAG TPA: hypothetical protein VHU83_14365 [Bryobacteraceae bacterium]|jgi:hypothetical protein|nr:hypothetical protein [Bryobacteraceae bacterium]